MEKVPSMNVADVAVIGAGPYGLSIAAHLQARGVSFRIFGQPMSTWLTQMPKGMRLKSEGFASSLADPDSAFTLRTYCQQQGLEYSDTGLPVPLSTFVAYGLAFQKRFVPSLEEKLVVLVEQSATGFELHLEDGEIVFARSVVMAVGITHFGHIPDIFAALPEGSVSHSSAHSDLEGFRGREIAVLGAGASALDLAALLHEAGASVQLIARTAKIRFHDPPQPRSLSERVRLPMTGIGPGWKLFFYVNAPLLFRKMSEQFRLDKVRKTLGPAPAWFIKNQVVGKVPLHLGVNITTAKAQNGRISLQLTDGAGKRQTLDVEHVIAATGYKVDLDRLAFLSPEIRERLRSVDKAPELSANFESSVTGLYFVGTSAANTFGPLMRFAYGSRFAARRVSRHLARPRYGKGFLPQETANVQALERS